MRFKKLRTNATLKADGKKLVFKDGVVQVKKITQDIQALIDAGYIQLEGATNG